MRHSRLLAVALLVLAVLVGTLYTSTTSATLSVTTARNDYVGNGATSSYSYTFRITAASDLTVTKRDTAGVETTLALTSDYTVTGVGSGSGGLVTLVAGNLPSGYALTIRRVLPLTQPTDLRNQGPFLAETHETVFDRLTMIDQQQQDALDRSVRVAPSIAPSAFSPVLPANILSKGGEVLRVKEDATGLETAPNIALAGQYVDANLAASGITTRSKLPSNLVYDDEANTFTVAPTFPLSQPLNAPTLQSYTTAGLPAAGTAGRLALVTDGIRGIWKDTGTAWVSVTGYADLKADFGTDAAAFTAASASGGPIFLQPGDYTVSTPVTITVNMRGSGRDTGRTRIILTGTGQLIVGDTNLHWSDFKITSEVNGLTMVKNSLFSHFKLDHFTIETAAGTSQIGIEYVTTGGGIAHNTIEHFMFNKVSYPVVVSGTGWFNNNKLGTASDYWQSFQSAIRAEMSSTFGVNSIEGYFETGVNVLSVTAGAINYNTFAPWLDGVTNAITTTVAIPTMNWWKILGSQFVTAGSGAVTNQVIVGDGGPCVTGFTSSAAIANYCVRNDFSATTWTDATACTGRAFGLSIPVGAVVNLYIEWNALSNNAIGSRSNTATFFSTSACTAGTDTMLSLFQQYEHAAVAAGTTIERMTEHFKVPVPVADTFYATQTNAGGNGNGDIISYGVEGYYRP